MTQGASPNSRKNPTGMRWKRWKSTPQSSVWQRRRRYRLHILHPWAYTFSRNLLCWISWMRNIQKIMISVVKSFLKLQQTDITSRRIFSTIIGKILEQSSHFLRQTLLWQRIRLNLNSTTHAHRYTHLPAFFLRPKWINVTWRMPSFLTDAPSQTVQWKMLLSAFALRLAKVAPSNMRW